MMRDFLAALGFLTRVPVPLHVFEDGRAGARSLPWYPAVGASIGTMLWLLAWLLGRWPPLLSAALLLLAWVTVTGALHLDGLADSADAWIGGIGDRERTLAIMKDPRCGPAGVVALVLVLLLKFAALASLPRAGSAALVLAPMLARAGLTLAFMTTPYVRPQGMGSRLREAPPAACRIALAVVVGVALSCGWHGLLALAVAGAVFALWRHACLKRLGGFTGDTCGALTELVEAAVLVALVAAAAASG